MRKIIVIIFIFQFHFFYGQDTLLFRNGEKKAVIVSEINPTDIKYIRFGTEYPQYVQSKNEVLLIKYKNGTVDSIKEVTIPEINSQKLEIVNARIFDQKGAVNDNKLWALLNKYPQGKTKEQLIFRYNELQKLDKRKLAWFLAGLGSGYITYISTIFSTESISAIPVAVVSLGVVTTSIYYFVKTRKKIRKKRVEFVNLYNASM